MTESDKEKPPQICLTSPWIRNANPFVDVSATLVNHRNNVKWLSHFLSAQNPPPTLALSLSSSVLRYLPFHLFSLPILARTSCHQDTYSLCILWCMCVCRCMCVSMWPSIHYLCCWSIFLSFVLTQHVLKCVTFCRSL